MSVYAKFRFALLRIKKALGIFWKQQELEWCFGTRLPGPKMDHVWCKPHLCTSWAACRRDTGWI